MIDTAPGRRRIPLHTKILIGLIIGVAVGLAANHLGTRPRSAPGVDALKLGGSEFVRGTLLD